jgi:S1-C subfamily serine protease
MALIPPFFLDCVVAIGSPSAPGGAQIQWTASGFLYGRRSNPEEEKKRYRTYLVTNRHVFDGKNAAVLRFNPVAAEPAKEYLVTLVGSSNRPVWVGHPDLEVDVAVLPINANLLKADGMMFHIFQDDAHAVNRAKMIELGLSEGDGVYALGFPMGLVGKHRNYVIVRQGGIARVRDMLAGASKEFLVDIGIFPGNSGGPLVSRPEAMAIEGTDSQQDAHLLGIVSEYLAYEDVAISAQTKRARIIFEENMGLAKVFPIDFIHEAIAVHLQAAGEAAPAAAPLEVEED